jgi:hypothetical protein
MNKTCMIMKAIQILQHTLFLGVLLSSYTLLRAQAPAFGQVEGGLLGLQYQQLDFADFNTQAQALGYPTLDDNLAEVYGGLMDNRGRWHNNYTAAFAWLDDGRSSASDNSTRYQAIALQWGSGYNILSPSKPWFVGPGIRMSFRWEQVVLAEQGLVNSLSAAQQANYLKLTRFSGFQFDFNVAVRRAFLIDKVTGSVLVAGLQAGYRLGSGDEEWKVDQAVDFQNSGLRSEGFFVGFQLGFAISSED